MVNRIIIKILWLLVFTLIVNAQEFKVRVSADSSDYLVGDYIHLKYTVTYNEGVSYQMPAIQDSITELTYIDKLPLRKYDSDNKLIDEHTFVFSKYDSAGVVVPSIKFKYTDKNGDTASAYTNEIALTVRTMEVNLQEEIQDIKSPQRIPLDWTSILLIALAVIALLTLAYMIYRYYVKKKEEKLGIKPVVHIPPHEIALKALYALEEQKLWQQGKVKEFHSRITEIVRRYFEARFSFLALEMPSSEVLDNLKQFEEGRNIYTTAESFFNNADMVKFAKFQPMPSVNEEMMKQSYEIVNATKEKAVVRETEEVSNVQ